MYQLATSENFERLQDDPNRDMALAPAMGRDSRYRRLRLYGVDLGRVSELRLKWGYYGQARSCRPSPRSMCPECVRPMWQFAVSSRSVPLARQKVRGRTGEGGVSRVG
jgi:hypothetical protein